MHTDLTITHEQNRPFGRYVIALGGGAEAELTYRWRDDSTMVVNHTGVPPSHQGQGIALALVEQVVADARAQGFRIVPQCPYVDVQFRRHPQWADLATS